MNISAYGLFRIIWLLAAIFNFAVQLAYFKNDGSMALFRAKKVTTPLLLFSGLLIVIVESGGFPLVPGVILLAMGLGEIGIEGSSVVEKHEGEDSGAGGSVIVLLAGILFLLVNVFIGAFLIITNEPGLFTLVSAAAALGVIALMLLICFRTFSPGPELRTQMLLYSIGLVILLAGVITDARGGLSALGLAGAVLTVSDSLVLIRMGAGFDKQIAGQRGILLAFLVVILLLYYFYMWLLIGIV